MKGDCGTVKATMVTIPTELTTISQIKIEDIRVAAYVQVGRKPTRKVVAAL